MVTESYSSSERWAPDEIFSAAWAYDLAFRLEHRTRGGVTLVAR